VRGACKDTLCCSYNMLYMKFVYKRNDPGHEGHPADCEGGGWKRDHTFLFGCFLTFFSLSLSYLSLSLSHTRTHTVFLCLVFHQSVTVSLSIPPPLCPSVTLFLLRIVDYNTTTTTSLKVAR